MKLRETAAYLFVRAIKRTIWTIGGGEWTHAGLACTLQQSQRR